MVKGWLTVAFLLACAGLRAASVISSIDRMFIESGEVLVVSVVAADVQPTQAPQIPPIQNVTASQYMGPLSSTQIINGVASSQVTLRYVLQTRGTGELVIPPLVVPTTSGQFKTEPVRCWILPNEEKTNLVTLKIATARDRYYVGETFPYELQLYAGANLNQLAPPKMSFDGFVVGRETPAASSQVQRQERQFGVVSYRKTVTPTKEGILALGPASEEFVADVTQRRRPRSLLDDFFGGGELQRGTAEAPPRMIQVLPLPAAGRPADFSGAIGRFTVTATASRTNLTLGDAVTVNFVVTGRGSFDGLPSPKLVLTDGLKAYSGTNSFDAAEPLGLTGTKTFEEVVIVESPAVKALNFEPYSFFDPETGRYTTARLGAIPILVRDGAGPGLQSSVTTNIAGRGPAPTPRADDLGYLQVRLGEGISLSEPWAASPWFAAVILGPLLAFGAAGGLRRLKYRQAQNRQPTRRSMAKLSVRDQLATMHEAEATGRSQQFFAALDAVLKQQIALTLGLGSGSAVTSDVIDSKLVPRGLSEESADRLRRLFAATDAARFAPIAMPEELATWRQLADAAIGELQGMEARE